MKIKYWSASGSGFPPSLIPALRNIGILHHKEAELRILLQQSVCPSIKKSVSYLGSYVTMYVSEEHFKYLVKSEMPSKRPFMTIHLFHLGYFIVPLHKTQITMVFTSPRYRGLIHKDQFESVSFWRATYFICTDAERIITWSFLA